MENQPADRRLARPKISIGSITGFFTVLIAITTATLWLGNLNRWIDDTVLRMDRLERDNGATSGIAGTAVGIVRGMGDAYCQNGPPAGDTTTPAQQAAWLLGQIVPPLNAAIAAAAPAPAH